MIKLLVILLVISLVWVLAFVRSRLVIWTLFLAGMLAALQVLGGHSWAPAMAYPFPADPGNGVQRGLFEE